LLPHFCVSNSEKMSECFQQLLKFLEPIMNKDVLNLRPVALKAFSSLIYHCRNAEVVDAEIKKTRKALQSITMDYIRGLVTLYTKNQDEEKRLKQIAKGLAPESSTTTFKRSEGQQQLLKTLQDFCSIAKVSKLSNLFLNSFAELVAIMEQLKAMDKRTQPQEVTTIKYNVVLRNVDVLFALMQKVKLNKENQLVMMQGVKVFIEDYRTKKKAYKLMARIVEKHELDNGVQELIQIHQGLTSMVEGQNSKQRLTLIRAYVKQIEKCAEGEHGQCTLQDVGDLLKTYIIELINAMTNTNLKMRTLAQEIFTSICLLMRCKFNAINQLFTIILVGLAGNNQSTQSSTIRSLIFTIKQNVVLNKQEEQPDGTIDAQATHEVDMMNAEEDDDFEDEKRKLQNEHMNKIYSSDPAFQQFIVKATRIISIFLKDQNASQELARSVLQFMKLSCNLLSDEALKDEGGMAKLLLDTMFQQKVNFHVRK